MLMSAIKIWCFYSIFRYGYVVIYLFIFIYTIQISDIKIITSNEDNQKLLIFYVIVEMIFANSIYLIIVSHRNSDHAKIVYTNNLVFSFSVTFLNVFVYSNTNSVSEQLPIFNFYNYTFILPFKTLKNIDLKFSCVEFCAVEFGVVEFCVCGILRVEFGVWNYNN